MKIYLLLMSFISFLALANNHEKEAVNRFIASQHVDHFPDTVSDDEIGILRHYFSLQEGLVSVLWTYKNGNHWQERLTLLKVNDTQHTVLSTISIFGKVLNAGKLDNLLSIELEEYADNDPRCCPSIKTTVYYQVIGSKHEKI